MSSSDPLDTLNGQVIDCLATLLADLGLVQWDRFGTLPVDYAAAEWPVYLGTNEPADGPSLVIAPGPRSYQGALINVQAQLRYRGKPDEPDSATVKADEVHRVLYPNGHPISAIRHGRIRVGAISPIGDTLSLPLDTARRSGEIRNVRLRLRWNG